MTSARDVVEPHIAAMLKEAETARLSTDAVARIMFEKVIHIWRDIRKPEDIKAELLEAAEHLDPDEDFMFMRP